MKLNDRLTTLKKKQTAAVSAAALDTEIRMPIHGKAQKLIQNACKS